MVRTFKYLNLAKFTQQRRPLPLLVMFSIVVYRRPRWLLSRLMRLHGHPRARLRAFETVADIPCRATGPPGIVNGAPPSAGQERTPRVAAEVSSYRAGP